jgi:hypothetical protein
MTPQKQPSGRHDMAEDDSGIPVLFPKLEMSSILQSVVLGIGARNVVDYAS